MNVRTKGHNWERTNRKDLVGIGFIHTKTSRSASKLMDDCKIDLIHLPLNIQSKCGYEKARPKYDKLYKECKELVLKNFPPDEADTILSRPYILMHKIDARKEENQTMTVSYKFGLKLLALYKKHLDEELLLRSQN